MEVRAGRKAGRAALADNFPLLHPVATVGGDPAHMGIARHQAALMLEADLLAIAAGPPRANDASIGGCEDRRAVAGAEIHALVHAGVTQDRMAALAEGRSHTAWNRTLEHAARIAVAGRLEPLRSPAIFPLHQLDVVAMYEEKTTELQEPK